MRARRLAIAVILAICVGGPVVEMFDHWDRTFQDGGDTEANAVVVALCVGMALAAVTTVLIARIRALSSNSAGRVTVSRPLPFTLVCPNPPVPTDSPPTPLRI